MCGDIKKKKFKELVIFNLEIKCVCEHKQEKKKGCLAKNWPQMKPQIVVIQWMACPKGKDISYIWNFPTKESDFIWETAKVGCWQCGEHLYSVSL